MLWSTSMNIHPGRIALVVHGGAGSSRQNEDGCITAAQHGFEVLRTSGDGMSAAVEAVVVLEDDERFNAGSGSIRRSDGATVETDAAVMDTRGRLGAVACLRRTKNPVRVARAVADTRHWLLAGDGAEQFARSQGYAPYDLLAHSRAAKRAADASCDTVGAVVLDAEGHFAIATSTGGAAPALPGRVGDTPIVGCGYYAGPHGAVALTGPGEHIVGRMLAREIYDCIAAGMPLQEALDRAMKMTPPDVGLGAIGVTRTEAAAASTTQMPFHILLE
jgi:L-asparaginase/beta-aspartyl-peptidase (threonine type)